MNKKIFWFQLGLVLVLAIGIDFVLLKIVPDWAKANILSILTFCLTVWLISVTRQVYIPQGNLAQHQWNQVEKENKEMKKGRAEAQAEKAERSGFKLYVVNTGSVDLKNVEISLEPNRDVTLVTNLTAIKWDILTAGDKRLVGGVAVTRDCQGYFETKISWECPDGDKLSKIQTFTI